jgi:TonB family protein
MAFIVWPFVLALANAQSIRVEDKGGPAVLYAPDPNYPAEALKRGVEGDVVLRIHIAADGRVDRVTPVSGHRLLVPPAVQAVKQFQFVPKAGHTDWSFRFNLKHPYYESGSVVARRVEPIYPATAKLKRVQGTVKLVALFNETGRVQDIHLISGDPLLVSAAEEAVRQWEFLRTRENGKRTGGSAVVELPFSPR